MIKNGFIQAKCVWNGCERGVERCGSEDEEIDARKGDLPLDEKQLGERLIVPLRAKGYCHPSARGITKWGH